MNKPTRLAFLFPPLSSFSEAPLSLHQDPRSDVNDLVLTNNPSLLTDDVSITSSNLRSTTNRFEVSTLIPRVPSNFRSLLVTLGFSMFFVPIANATNYYVATNGSDSNPGTLSSPWKTINKAANTLVAGDAVSIRAGTYKEQVTPKNSGSASVASLPTRHTQMKR